MNTVQIDLATQNVLVEADDKKGATYENVYAKIQKTGRTIQSGKVLGE